MPTKPTVLRAAMGALAITAAVAAPAMAEDPSVVDGLEQRARQHLVEGNLGAADEAIRAAIVLSGPDDFNQLALLQGLIAAHLGSDGRSLLGAATAAHESNAWPRPVIAYLLGERKLQQVADAIRTSGDSFDVMRLHVCELTLYAGAFAAIDHESHFAQKLLQKAATVCDRDSPERALVDAELARLRSP